MTVVTSQQVWNCKEQWKQNLKAVGFYILRNGKEDYLMSGSVDYVAYNIQEA